jgi:hypothetical protein
VKAFRELVFTEAALMQGNLVHVKSHLFAWNQGERLVSLIGPAETCSILVSELLDRGLMPDRSSHTSLDANGKTLFRPVDLHWVHRRTYLSSTVSDFIFLRPPDAGQFTNGQCALSLFERSTTDLDRGLALSYIVKAMQNAQVWQLPMDAEDSQVKSIEKLLSSGKSKSSEGLASGGRGL